MERKQAGMAAWAIVFVVFAAVASTWWAVSSAPPSAGVVAAAAAQASVSPGSIRVNGSQPLIPLKIRVHGRIWGLESGSRPESIEVVVNGRPMPVVLDGFDYTAQIDGSDLDAMAVVEVRSKRVHYRSVLGSVRRLAALAGTDAYLAFDEHSALHVSPYSTALALMVSASLGGTLPASDAAFEQATRRIVGPDLGVATFALRVITQGERPLPVGYQNGTQLLADRVAYSTWLQQNGFQTAEIIHRGFVELEFTRGVSQVKEVNELPERLVLTSALAGDAIVSSAEEVTVVERRADGNYSIYENEPGPLAGFSPVAESHPHNVLLLPLHDVVMRNLDLRDRLYERRSRGHSLTRLTRGENFDVWLVRSDWYEKDLDSGAPETEVTEYRVLSGFSLSAQQRMDGWPAMTTAARALPWLCLENYARPYWLLSQCDYVQHQMLANGSGSTFDHEWKLDSAGQPRVPSAGQSFAWSKGSDGVLNVVHPQSDTRFWRIGGGTAHVGHLVYVSRHTGVAGDQYVAGLTSMVTRAFSEFPAATAVGTWALSHGGVPGFTWPSEAASLRATRSADGSGLLVSLLSGNSRPSRWQVVDNSVVDVERRASFAGAPAQHVQDCAAAMAAGASNCLVTTRYFKPLQKMPDLMTYNGILETYLQLYANTPPVPPGQAFTLQRIESRPGQMVCVQGECRQAPPAAASIPSLSTKPAPVETARRSPTIRPVHLRIPRLMPIYAFECTQCGHSFDRLQKLSDPDPDTCPACGAQAVKRQLTAPSFRLAGSGWYETDFKKEGDKKRNLADGGEGAKPSSEAKPAESSPAKAESAPAKTESKPAAPSSTSST